MTRITRLTHRACITFTVVRTNIFFSRTIKWWFSWFRRMII
ncbi:hypothetical protein LDVICp154 [lymphocystis disease virus-China]|uniref:Uncharacterized protein n=1 Tax=lymphocystis disease virus-China TaxID=256729 RepID=Q677V8_9VIRU|nr:hypothetical protein LDVICp154 [lymphocystis disease virus-China]AAU10999.1 hypothetical protein [lymphocystis disease virus-China]